MNWLQRPSRRSRGGVNTRVGSVGGMLGRILVGRWSAILCEVLRRELYRRGTATGAAGREGDSEGVTTEPADVLAPSTSQYDAYTLDAVLRDTKGVPPEVLQELALAG
jgi:hypothetical protein